jgi:hypothetical protein
MKRVRAAAADDDADDLPLLMESPRADRRPTAAVLFVKPDPRANMAPLTRLFITSDSDRAISVFLQIKAMHLDRDNPATFSKNLDRLLAELSARASDRSEARAYSFAGTTPLDAIPEAVRDALGAIGPLGNGHVDIVQGWSHSAANANVPILRVLSFSPSAPH